jgi:hypothetical protein
MIRRPLYACDEAKESLRLLSRPPVPEGNRALKLGLPPVNAWAFATLPGWARRMYGRSGGPLTDIAATAGAGHAPGARPAAAFPCRYASGRPRRMGRRKEGVLALALWCLQLRSLDHHGLAAEDGRMAHLLLDRVRGRGVPEEQEDRERLDKNPHPQV